MALSKKSIKAEHAISRAKKFKKIRKCDNTHIKYGNDAKGSETDGMISEFRKDLNVVVKLANLHIAMDDILAGRGLVARIMAERRKKPKIE